MAVRLYPSQDANAQALVRWSVGAVCGGGGGHQLKLHNANPTVGPSDEPTMIQQTAKVPMETDKFLITIEGPWYDNTNKP
jgi:hypothetical protein